MSKNLDTLIKNLVDEATKFQFETDIKRIKEGKRLNISNKPYNLITIDNMIKFYENKEDYENCSLLTEFKLNITNHEGNYLGEF